VSDRRDETPHPNYREFTGACCGNCQHYHWQTDDQFHCERETEVGHGGPVVSAHGVCDRYNGPARYVKTRLWQGDTNERTWTYKT